MDEVPKPKGIGPKLFDPAFVPPSPTPAIPDIGGIATTIGGPVNWCTGGAVGPIAAQAINPPALAQVFQLVRDIFGTLGALGQVNSGVADLAGKLGAGWSSGQAATNAMAKYVNINGCFGKVTGATAAAQKQAQALGDTQHKAMMDFLMSTAIGNGVVGAMMSNPFTAPAAPATAWGRLMQIVKWLMMIKTAIVGIADVVKAVKEVTREVDATATQLGAPPVAAGTGYPLPAGYGGPTGYGAPGTTMPGQVPGAMSPPTSGYPQGPLTQSPYQQPNPPTVYNSGAYNPSGAYSSGWIPETPDGVDADGDRVTITVTKDGEVRVDAPDDRRLEIDVDIDADGDGKREHYDFDIKPA